jgi:PIF1 helicase.
MCAYRYCFTQHRRQHHSQSIQSSGEDSSEGERCYEKKKLETIAKADVIIIDEISMCRIDVFEYVAKTLLYFKPKKQLLFVGDFYQLPPVLPSQDSSAFSQIYGNKLFAFESEMWTMLELHTMELQTSMRQKDKAFVSALDNIRAGHPDFSLFQTDKPARPHSPYRLRNQPGSRR